MYINKPKNIKQEEEISENFSSFFYVLFNLCYTES